MKRLSILTAIILAAAALMASFQNCYACTGITLKAKDGSTVVARTIEWAASDNDCRWVVVPRGHIWKSFIPGGGTGRSFTNEYERTARNLRVVPFCEPMGICPVCDQAYSQILTT